jgi:hypothetical protein
MARIQWKRALRVVVTVVVLGALFAGAGMLVQSKKASLAAAPRYGVGALPVRVATVRRGDLESVRDDLAVVEPLRSASLSSRLTAGVQEGTTYGSWSLPCLPGFLICHLLHLLSKKYSCHQIFLPIPSVIHHPPPPRRIVCCAFPGCRAW